jgi:hypothetical protein
MRSGRRRSNPPESFSPQAVKEDLLSDHWRQNRHPAGSRSELHRHLPAQPNYHQSNYFRETTFVNNQAYKTALIAISTVEATELRIPSFPCKPVMRKCARNPGHRTKEGMRRVMIKICNNAATANPTPIAFLKVSEHTLPTRQQKPCF